VYESWKDVVVVLLRGYSNGAFLAWTIPCLYTAGKYLRIFAIKADDNVASLRDSGMAFGGLQEEDAFGSGGKHEKLEDAARQINRIFGICISDRYVHLVAANNTTSSPDSSLTAFPKSYGKCLHPISVHRAPLPESRKWALYYIANLLFKTYFRLNSISLSKNILRSLSASAADMPPLEHFPRVGVLAFLEEDYARAEENLEGAYAMCLHTSNSQNRNVELILTYLIPTKLLTTHRLPTTALLAAHPRLDTLFSPIASAIRSADLRALDAALLAGETVFIQRRIYLTLERSRDVAVRNLFRKVFLAGGYEPRKEGEVESDVGRVRRTRVPIAEFAAALALAGADVRDEGSEEGWDGDEVECVVSNCIYKVRLLFAGPFEPRVFPATRGGICMRVRAGIARQQ
jgi:hypothetical protein